MNKRSLLGGELAIESGPAGTTLRLSALPRRSALTRRTGRHVAVYFGYQHRPSTRRGRQTFLFRYDFEREKRSEALPESRLNGIADTSRETDAFLAKRPACPWLSLRNTVGHTVTITWDTELSRYIVEALGECRRITKGSLWRSTSQPCRGPSAEEIRVSHDIATALAKA